MDVHDEQYMLFRRRGLDGLIPGLVRMDRAMLYLRQRLDALISDLQTRSTKTIGETGYYKIIRFAREATLAM